MNRYKTVGILMGAAILSNVSIASAQRWGREATPQSGACFYENINFGGRPAPAPQPAQSVPPQARPASPAPHLKLSARADGSFEMINSRTGFTKKYSARK